MSRGPRLDRLGRARWLASISGDRDRGIDGKLALPRLLCGDGLAGGGTSERRTRLLAHPGMIRANMRLVHRNVTD